MSPYEIREAGGSVEHWNAEPGWVWLRRAQQQWPHSIWLNPVQEDAWKYTASIGMIRQLFDGRMYPLTLRGLEAATRELSRKS